MKRIYIALAGCFVATLAMAQTSTYPTFNDATVQTPTDSLMTWYDRASLVCMNQVNGEVNQACLDRTALAAVLEKRGYCQDSTPGKIGITGMTRWQRCMVNSGQGYYTGENPSLQKYLQDRNNYYLQGIEPNGQTQ